MWIYLIIVIIFCFKLVFDYLYVFQKPTHLIMLCSLHHVKAHEFVPLVQPLRDGSKHGRIYTRIWVCKWTHIILVNIFNTTYIIHVYRTIFNIHQINEEMWVKLGFLSNYSLILWMLAPLLAGICLWVQPLEDGSKGFVQRPSQRPSLNLSSGSYLSGLIDSTCRRLSWNKITNESMWHICSVYNQRMNES